MFVCISLCGGARARAYVCMRERVCVFVIHTFVHALATAQPHPLFKGNVVPLELFFLNPNMKSSKPCLLPPHPPSPSFLYILIFFLDRVDIQIVL